MKVIVTAAVVALVFLNGCGTDPRAANNSNFQRAVDEKLEKPESRLCVDLIGLSLPYKALMEQQPWSVNVPEDVHRPDASATAKLEALVTAKLAAKQTAKAALTVSKLNPTTFRMDESIISAPEIVYEPGPEFSKYAVVTPSLLIGSDTKLCFASLQVDRIENFSEPGQAMGATVSSVYYRAKAINVANWVTEPAMRAAFPSIDSDLQQATTTQRSDMVVLMSDGWQAQ